MKLTDLAILTMILAATLYVLLQPALSDLPYVHHPDEPINLGVLHAMLEGRTANPHFFNYPSLFFYLNIPGQWLAQSFSDAPITLQSQAMGSTFAPVYDAVLFARATSLFAHLITVSAVFCFLVSRTGKPIATAASVLAALSPLVFSFSFWAAPDVFASLFITLCLIATVRIVETGQMRTFVFAGAMAGFAAATKYNAGFVVIAIATPSFLAPGPKSDRADKLARSALVTILAFIIGAPFFFLDFGNAMSGLRFEIQHYSDGHFGADGDSMRFNATHLIKGLGLALIFAFLATRHKSMWPILAFVLGYFLLLSSQFVRFERNLAPLLPALAMLAAIAAAYLSNCVTGTLKQVSGIVLALMIAAPVATTTLQPAAPSPHAAQRVWLEQALPDDARVVVEAYTPYISPQRRSIDAVRFAFVEDWETKTPSHLVLSSGASNRFQTDPRTKKTFAAWLNGQISQSCATLGYPTRENWSVLVLSFECGHAAVR